MTDYYEPWRFEFGQRVRVRLSGECQYARTVNRGTCAFPMPHLPATDGETGTVVLTGRAAYAGHPYYVALDVLDGLVVPAGDWFAACELEPCIEDDLEEQE